MEAILRDLRFGIRMMARSPGFTVVALITIALGIGANTAIFSVVNTVLLRPLPYQDPNRLVVLWERSQQVEQESASYPNFLDWRAQNESFDGMAIARRDSLNLTGAGEPERLLARQVSGDFFSVLGVQPQLGRSFAPEEDEAGANPVVVLSNVLWKRRFGSDPDIVGKPITLSDRSFIVIGVLPSNFQFYTPADVFLSINLNMPERLKAAREEHGGVVVVARLKAGVSRERAIADMDNIARNLEQQYPKTNNTNRVTVTPMHDDQVGDIRPSLLILLGAVGFVLLIACANVANLLLARASARQKEIAIRTALGASRARLICQLLTESMLLSMIGGALGLLLALWAKDLFVGTITGTLPWVKEIGLDRNVLVFTLAASALTGILFGLVPALQTSRADLNESLKEGGRGSTSGRHRVRNLLIVSEVALALVLLIGAGLMLKSFAKVRDINPGFDPKNLLTMQFALSFTKYSDSAKARAFYREVQRRVETLPGVEAAAFATSVPLNGATVTSVLLEGQKFSSYGDANLTVQSSVGVNYLNAMGISLLSGRSFTEADTEKTPLVATIDENMARTLFAGQDPIGQHLFLNEGEIRFEVIGVAPHVRHLSFEGDAQSKVRFQMYTDYNQIPDQWFAPVTQQMNLVVRTASEPLAFSGALRSQVYDVDKDQPIYNVKTMEQIVGDTGSQRRFSMLLLGAFASVALALAAIGIYGVISYSVTQRSHEIGIRMALGARRSDVLNLVVGQGLKLVMAGVAIGLGGAFALTRVMSSLLFGVSATDPVIFMVTSIVLTGVALAASVIPARRATRVDPMMALRYE